MKYQRFTVISAFIFLMAGCATNGGMGTLLTKPKDYEIYPMGENQYLLRTSVGIFESGLISSWHKKAEEICKKQGYEGAPKIYTSRSPYRHGFGGGAGTSYTVAAGPVRCIQKDSSSSET
ncbi:MAG: hypothetical protein ABW149_01710 [Sedimenticola sp.]